MGSQLLCVSACGNVLQLQTRSMSIGREGEGQCFSGSLFPGDEARQCSDYIGVCFNWDTSGAEWFLIL